MTFFEIVAIFIFCFLLLSGFRISQEYQRTIVFRLGRFANVR